MNNNNNNKRRNRRGSVHHRGMGTQGKTPEKVSSYHGVPMSCVFCGCHDRSKLTVDHIVPRSNGGCSHTWNLLVLCASCNSRRMSKDATKCYSSASKKIKTIVQFAVEAHELMMDFPDLYMQIDNNNVMVVHVENINEFRKDWFARRLETA